MRLVRLSPWLLGVLLNSCGSTDPATEAAPVSDQPLPQADCARGASRPSAAGDDFALKTAVDFASCGQQRLAYAPACCAIATAGYDCLVAALDACAPARLGEVYGTVEGAAIFLDYFVVPLEGGCEVVVVTDNGQDNFRDTNYPAVSKRHCGLARTRAAASAGACPSLDVDACSP
jgi:hypothetical protein